VTLTEQQMWAVVGAVAVVFIVMVAVSKFDVHKDAAATVRLLAFCVLVVVVWFIEAAKGT
jgi:hypothetical protein